MAHQALALLLLLWVRSDGVGGEGAPPQTRAPSLAKPAPSENLSRIAPRAGSRRSALSLAREERGHKRSQPEGRGWCRLRF